MKPIAHKILFTGDCNYLFANDYRPPGERRAPYTARVLDDHAELLASSGVDTHLINPNGQVPWQPSKALPSVIDGYTRGDRDFVRPHYPPLGEDFFQEQLDAAIDANILMLDRLLDLAEAGIDWVAYLAEACRKQGVSPWASVRMNDGHGANNWEGSYFNCPPQRDPRLRLSATRMDPRLGSNPYARVCNFEHQEVRDYYFSLIRELVEDYNLDGIELDWTRMPACCEPPASEETIAVITAWHGQLRDLMRKRASSTGRPFYLGLRIPCRLGALRTIGLDVAEMARRDTIDFVSVSNTWQTTWDVPYDSLRASLGDEVALYGVIEDAPNWMFAKTEQGHQGYRLLSTSAELIRGNAAGKLAMGADGIEFFNFFCSDSEGVHGSAAFGAADYTAIKRIDDLAFLRGKPKQYALSTSFNYWATSFFEYAEQLPVFIEPGGWKSFRISLCAEPLDAGLELEAQIVLARSGTGTSSEPRPKLGVSLNGSWPTFDGKPSDQLLMPTGAYTHHLPEHEAWNYPLNLASLQDGWNEIVLYHNQDHYYPHPRCLEAPLHVIGVEMAVRS
ncbi:MAG: hypothetical protein O3B01_25815 [Planctomycetota bacterium]|nr:hypothetical protein [Planctomycetota bacterium]MDA1141994.1 hypothetical protein [Planctomycetota bacterium]